MHEEVKRVSKGLRKRALRHLDVMEELLAIGTTPTHPFMYRGKLYNCATQNGRLVVWRVEIEE